MSKISTPQPTQDHVQVTFELPLMIASILSETGEADLALKVYPAVVPLEEIDTAGAPEVARVSMWDDEWIIRHSDRHGYLLQFYECPGRGEALTFAVNDESGPLPFCEPQHILCELMPSHLRNKFWPAWHAAEEQKLPRYPPFISRDRGDQSNVGLQMLKMLNVTRRFKVVDGQLCLSIPEPYLSVDVRPDVVVGFGMSDLSSDVAVYRLNEYAQAAGMLETARKAMNDYVVTRGGRPIEFYDRASPIIWVSSDYPAGDFKEARAACAAIRLKQMIVKHIEPLGPKEITDAWAMFSDQSQSVLMELLAIADASPLECFDPKTQALARKALTMPGNPFLDRVIASDPFPAIMIEAARKELFGDLSGEPEPNKAAV